MWGRCSAWGLRKLRELGLRFKGSWFEPLAFRFKGQGSHSPEAAGYHQEHSVHYCTHLGQLSGRRSQVLVTLPGPVVPQHLRHGTSLPSCPGGSFPSPLSAGKGWGEGMYVHLFVGNRWSVYMHVGQSMESAFSPHQSWSAR